MNKSAQLDKKMYKHYYRPTSTWPFHNTTHFSHNSPINNSLHRDPGQYSTLKKRQFVLKITVVVQQKGVFVNERLHTRPSSWLIGTNTFCKMRVCGFQRTNQQSPWRIRLNTLPHGSVSRRQVQMFLKFKKKSNFLNLVTIFGISMRNAFK